MNTEEQRSKNKEVKKRQSLTIVFCLPGASFSGAFLECWTELLAWCLANNIRPILSRKHSCNIYYVRNMCLGADVSRGPHQKPFNGTIDYDYIMWIDSDIMFKPQQFARLLGHGKDIVSGIYLMEGGEAFATVKEWNEEYFARHGHFRFLRKADLQSPQNPQSLPRAMPRGEFSNPQVLEVAYTGMGFMLVKKGVFESMEYPWFRPVEKRIGEMVDFTMEDVAFCLRAKEKGFTVLIDPVVRVGHEKKITL